MRVLLGVGFSDRKGEYVPAGTTIFFAGVQKEWISAAVETGRRPIALNVSFLEDIDFEGPRGSHAWSLLSETLQNAWSAMAAYNERLHSAVKKKSRDRRR